MTTDKGMCQLSHKQYMADETSPCHEIIINVLAFSASFFLVLIQIFSFQALVFSP